MSAAGGGVAIEVELKLGLADPAGMSTLLACLPAPTQTVTQRNTYLGDPDRRLERARIMVRVREVFEHGDDGVTARSSLVMTAKVRERTEAGVFRALEVEQALPVQRWEAFLRGEATLHDAGGDMLCWLSARCPVDRFTVIGTMTNLRRNVSYRGFPLELDVTQFPGDRVEAEIEVEGDDAEGARAVLYALAADAGVTLFEQQLGKYARFLRCLADTE